ncbi:MAG TPA: hypothetical protein VIS07_09820 [Candidatus Binatia bacterium]
MRINRCLLLAVLLAVVHLARFEPTRQPIVTDVRYYVYFAERIVDGAIPHRDYFDNKTQLAAMAGAAFDLVGRALGVEPLLAMRVGYLALTGLAALLVFAILRRLFDGSCVAGLLGLACYLGFSLLGFLPSIGPLPKLLMMVLACAAALLAARGAWLVAGACGALAFFDWQIGALVGVAVFVASLAEREERTRAVVRTVAGGAGMLALVAGWLAWHGALVTTYEQVVSTSLARGSSALARKTLPDRVAQIAELVERGCPGHEWLVVLGLLGLLLFPLVVWRNRGRPTQRLALVIGVFGAGIVAFTLTDFQAFGDLFALLASLSVFAGAALGLLYTAVQQRLVTRPAASRAVAVATVLVALVALRIGRPRLDIAFPHEITRGATALADQVSVARKLDEETRGLRLLIVNCSEQLYLTGRTNLLPIAFWNRASHDYFRGTSPEISRATLIRMITAADPDAVACPTKPIERELERNRGFERLVLRADEGEYEIVLLRRRDARPHDGAGSAAGDAHARF